eukprot:9612108-Karenia_brevis.AAC.1
MPGLPRADLLVMFYSRHPRTEKGIALRSLVSPSMLVDLPPAVKHRRQVRLGKPRHNRPVVF